MMLNKILHYFAVLLFIIFPLVTFSQEAIKTQEVVFSAQNDSISYGATVTLPAKEGQFPSLVILSGSGAQDRDGTMGGQKLFARVAEYITSRGYVVLRMDDRGVGKTTGNYENATTEDFANDALEALRYLKSLPNVDTSLMGLLGHSEGGAAMSIAATKSRDVSFLVSLAGLATNGYESLLLQNEALVDYSPQSKVDKMRSNEVNRLMFSTAYQYALSDSLENKLNNTYNYWKEKDDIYFKTLGIEHDHFRFPIWYYVKQATGRWYRYFVRYNAEKTLNLIDIPILAINGDQDAFVQSSNLDHWNVYSAAGRKGKVTTHLLKNTNHLMQYCGSKSPMDYNNLGPIEDSTMETIVNWLNTIIRNK